MRYASTHGRPRRRYAMWVPILGTGIGIVGLLALFAVSVKAFRSRPEEPVTPAQPLLAGILEPRPVHVTSESLGEGARQAELHALDGTGALGIATRGEKDGHFYFTVRTTLTGIDRETQAYEVWVIQELPYDFMRLGEMVTNDAGEFIFEWEPEESKDPNVDRTYAAYAGFTNIVITREAKDGNADPGTRVMTGEFRVR